MGLSVNSYLIVQKIDENHNIVREQTKLEHTLLSLTLSTDAATLEYTKARNQKCLQWSNNAGITCTDINYSLLMSYNAANSKSPALITDNSGRIVVNNQHRKYAEMISPKGAPGGDWSGENRLKILAALTGVSESDIKLAESTSQASDDAADDYNDAQASYEQVRSKSYEHTNAGTDYLSMDQLSKKMGTVKGNDLSKLYSKGTNGTYVIYSSNDFKTLADGIYNNMSKYFVDDDSVLNVQDKTAFKKACDAFADYYTSLYDSSTKTNEQKEQDGLKKITDSMYLINISQAFDCIMSQYATTGSTVSTESGETAFVVRDTTSDKWQNWYKELQAKKSEFDAAKSDYKTSVDTANQVLTAEQENKIKYYDLLFQSIVDNGWTYDEHINDSDYLNQKFQNNDYYITTITENKCFDPEHKDLYGNSKFEYDTSIAANFSNIYTVNDDAAADRAQAKLDTERTIRNQKEARINSRLKTLETRYQANQKIIESSKKLLQDSTERTFGIFA